MAMVELTYWPGEKNTLWYLNSRMSIKLQRTLTRSFRKLLLMLLSLPSYAKPKLLMISGHYAGSMILAIGIIYLFLF